MTPLQKATIRASEIRASLAEIAGKEKLEDADKAKLAELRAEYTDIETRIQSLTIAESEPVKIASRDGEDAELAKLESRASIGEIVHAAIGGPAAQGATAELQQHFGMQGNMIPHSLMMEKRAVTPAPSDTGSVQSPIIQYVYPVPVASWFSIQMPTVPVGQHVYTVLTTPASAGLPAADADQAETTGAFTATNLSPARVQAGFFFRREDRAQLQGMSEALRQNLSEAIAAKLQSNFVQDSTGGLPSVAVTTVANRMTFDSVINAVSNTVDGRYAENSDQLRALTGSAVYGYGATLRRANSNDLSIMDTLRDEFGGIKVSSHVIKNSGSTALAKTQDMHIRRGMRMQDAVIAVWDGLEIIEDPYTRAGTGHIEITAIQLFAQSILRSDGFARLRLQVDA